MSNALEMKYARDALLEYCEETLSPTSPDTRKLLKLARAYKRKFHQVKPGRTYGREKYKIFGETPPASARP